MGWIEEPDKPNVVSPLTLRRKFNTEQVRAISFWETQDAARELGILYMTKSRMISNTGSGNPLRIYLYISVMPVRNYISSTRSIPAAGPRP